MRCSACQVEVNDNPKEHYVSELHKINVRSQIYNAPPISYDEFTKESISSDISLEIYNNEDSSIQFSSEYSNKQPKTRNNKKKVIDVCIFCEEEESYEHYTMHGLDAKECTYILNKTCYLCNEGFTNKTGLKEHIQNDKHRTAVLHNNNLILENGKIIYNKSNGSSSTSNLVKYETRSKYMIRIEKQTPATKFNNELEKNKLKSSMQMNSQKHFRPDWMQ